MAWAKSLALRERVCTVLLNIPFTTRDFDAHLSEPDYRKIIEDARTGRLQPIRNKPTTRDMLEKAKRNPSTWPEGVNPEFTDVDTDIIKRKEGGKEVNR